MNESTDEVVVLQAAESSVLVHGTPLSARPTIDTTARLGDNPRIADVRFGRPLPQLDPSTDTDVRLISPTVPDGVDPDHVYEVNGPDNLTEYGVALTQAFEDADGPILVRLDSLTALLQHVTLNAAFRFVHVLSGRVDREEAVLVATIDPGAHDEQTLATMTQPFDVAVTGEAGSRRVRRRN